MFLTKSVGNIGTDWDAGDRNNEGENQLIDDTNDDGSNNNFAISFNDSSDSEVGG